MTAATRDGSILAGYDSPGAWDEVVSNAGELRPHYGALIGALEGRDLANLADAVRGDLIAAGCEFGSDDGPQPFIVDPVPRVIDGEEWDAVVAGLAQRVRALNAFIADV